MNIPTEKEIRDRIATKIPLIDSYSEEEIKKYHDLFHALQDVIAELRARTLTQILTDGCPNCAEVYYFLILKEMLTAREQTSPVPEWLKKLEEL